MAKPLPELSLSDWAVLAVVAEGETHGWPVVRELRADGALGQVWTVGRAVVYRSLSTLVRLGFIEELGDTPGARGPQRTIVRATRSGHAGLRRWLATPVEHVREVRTEFLLKLAVLDRAGRSPGELIERQVEQLAPLLQAVTKRPSGDGFDLVLARWRREQALAVERFLRSLSARDPVRTLDIALRLPDSLTLTTYGRCCFGGLDESRVSASRRVVHGRFRARCRRVRQ